jgi:hypothetical protein
MSTFDLFIYLFRGNKRRIIVKRIITKARMEGNLERSPSSPSSSPDKGKRKEEDVEEEEAYDEEEDEGDNRDGIEGMEEEEGEGEEGQSEKGTKRKRRGVKTDKEKGQGREQVSSMKKLRMKEKDGEEEGIGGGEGGDDRGRWDSEVVWEGWGLLRSDGSMTGSLRDMAVRAMIRRLASVPPVDFHPLVRSSTSASPSQASSSSQISAPSISELQEVETTDGSKMWHEEMGGLESLPEEVYQLAVDHLCATAQLRLLPLFTKATKIAIDYAVSS